MNFAEQLKPLVEKAGGISAAARLCGVTRQTMAAWHAGQTVPNLVTRSGVLFLLGTPSNELPSTAVEITITPNEVRYQEPQREPVFGGMLKAP